eukprot:TRINITY_DN8765_c0_g2_i1.p1 TRINITY_DN8765_c0_g2~~TRINITY_DN8765_c0_g2_i1.p1  ORF type:complete len:395 (+),score=92.65 TRINITY_DN8765_c0_g2_i1:221-1405(+)
MRYGGCEFASDHVWKLNLVFYNCNECHGDTRVWCDECDECGICANVDEDDVTLVEKRHHSYIPEAPELPPKYDMIHTEADINVEISLLETWELGSVVSTLIITPQDNLLSNYWDEDHTIIQAWDISGMCISELNIPDAILSIAVDPISGAMLLCEKTKLLLWDFKDSNNTEAVLVSDKISPLLPHAKYSMDGKYIIVAYREHCEILDRDGEVHSSFDFEISGFSILYFDVNPVDYTFMLAISDSTLRVYDFEGNLLSRVKSKDPSIFCSFNPDGDLYLSITTDKIAKVYTRRGVCLASLKHDNIVESAVFSPDSMMIFVLSERNEASLWDIKGNLLTTIESKHVMNQAVFTSDGRYLLIADDGWNITKYEVSTEKLNEPISSNESTDEMSVDDI